MIWRFRQITLSNILRKTQVRVVHFIFVPYQTAKICNAILLFRTLGRTWQIRFHNSFNSKLRSFDFLFQTVIAEWFDIVGNFYRKMSLEYFSKEILGLWGPFFLERSHFFKSCWDLTFEICCEFVMYFNENFLQFLALTEGLAIWNLRRQCI